MSNLSDEGSIKVDGQETVGLGLKERDRMMRKFGMLFQGAALFDSLPVWENVAFGLIHGKAGVITITTRARGCSS